METPRKSKAQDKGRVTTRAPVKEIKKIVNNFRLYQRPYRRDDSLPDTLNGGDDAYGPQRIQ